MMRAAIILNPATADVPELRDTVEKAMVSAGWATPIWLETTPEDPGGGMAETAATANVQLVVVCGGDGTIMACLDTLAGTDLPVALLPSGTGNLLARNLDVPLDLSDALAVAFHGSHRRIDLGRVDAKPFAVMAGIGFDAAMMADASEGLKQHAGWAAYVVSGLRHLRDPVMRVQLRIDDGPPLRRRARTVLVGNVGRLQGGLELLPDAAADDGLLDIVVVAPRTIPDWIRLVWRVFRRDRRPHPHLERFCGREIAIEADRVAPRQMDGEVIDSGRSLRARIQPGALVVCVPQVAATAA